VYRPLVDRSDAATPLLDALLERSSAERLSDDDIAKVTRVIARKKT
jgi:hypothetical protein